MPPCQENGGKPEMGRLGGGWCLTTKGRLLELDSQGQTGKAGLELRNGVNRERHFSAFGPDRA